MGALHDDHGDLTWWCTYISFYYDRTEIRLMGLIESKKKKGSVITSPDLFGMMSKSMNPHILDQETLREIFEIRLVLEIGMADLIFQRITKQDLEELKKIVSNEPPATQYHLFNIEHEIAFMESCMRSRVTTP